MSMLTINGLGLKAQGAWDFIFPCFGAVEGFAKGDLFRNRYGLDSKLKYCTIMKRSQPVEILSKFIGTGRTKRRAFQR